MPVFEYLGLRAADRLLDRLLDTSIGRALGFTSRHRPQLIARPLGGYAGSGEGTDVPAVARNTSPQKAWDVTLVMLLDGKETDRKHLVEVEAEAESQPVDLRVPLMPGEYEDALRAGRLTCQVLHGGKVVGTTPLT